MPVTDQCEYDIRCECGERGLAALAVAELACFAIVDVLSFSTCVTVAVEAGAEIFPYFWRDARAQAYAAAHDALLAGAPGSPYSLAVESLSTLTAGTRLVLPSPNGSTLAYAAAARGTVVAGCLRNRRAVSAFLNERLEHGPIAIIAAGERWPDGSLRPCLEDWIGAGAIIAGLNGSRSPEAESVLASYEAVADRLPQTLTACSSGRELIEKGHPSNVSLAAAVDSSNCVPVLRDGRFIAVSSL